MIEKLGIARPLAAIALTAMVLSGCGSDSKQALTCPSASILANASSLTTFKPGMHDDPKGELFTVSIVDVQTDCTLDVDNGTTDSSLTLKFRAKRTASQNAASYHVPYFVAVSLDGKVLAKRDIRIDFGFEQGQESAAFRDEVASTVINLENGKKPYEYGLVVGLQLTHDQLEYNKKMSRFAP